MPTVYVAAGSNIRPREHLRQALAMMRQAWPDLRVSPAYANKAVGFEGEDFINLVAGFDTDEPVEDVLARLHRIEAACGRPRAAAKWAPRSMDLDILMYGDVVGGFPGVILPRPDLLRRPYMLGPLADIAPDAVHPAECRPIRELWRQFDGDAHELRPVTLEGAD
jgi:2-amino-4-hydroxy-6-hydroxymethyldihydropteridine diphosphokinase